MLIIDLDIGLRLKTLDFEAVSQEFKLRVCNERHWIPACAGSEWGIWIACDPPTQLSSHAGDDSFRV
jgi:hypothetical protein